MGPGALTRDTREPGYETGGVSDAAPGSGSDSRIGWRTLALALVAMALWFGLLDHRPLRDPDEGRYAEIAREMLVSGDWTTPRLNGLIYLEKPPLQYWATAVAFKLLGQGNGAARLFSVLAGLAGVLLAFHAGRRL